MTTKQLSHYLEFLAQNYNILMLSNKSYKEYEEIETFFANGIQRNLHDSELENINITLMTNKIEIVILDSTENAAQAKLFYNALLNYNNRIVVVTIINRNINSEMLDLIESSDHIVFDTFSSNQLKGKLVQVLSVFYAVLSIGRRDIRLKSGSSDINTLVNFLDLYEGSSLFIVDELIELNQELKAGELSKELLVTIGKKCYEIADIFSKNEMISAAAVYFKDLGDFLINLDLSAVKPSGLKAFDYLCYIINDLNKTLMDMFVDRIFQDVAIFEHSLENNIEFMKLNLFPEANEDKSQLDFFE